MEKFRPASRTLPSLLDEVVEEFGAREAVVDACSRLTYSTLREQSRAVAKGLLAQGIGRDDKVAILMGNRAEWVVSALAISMLGAVVVGVNTWSSKDELDYLLNHADAKAIIATSCFLKKDFAQIIDGLAGNGSLPQLSLRVLVDEERPAWTSLPDLIETGADIADEQITGLAQSVMPEDVAILIYTSGSTSRPKGVQLVHKDLIASCWGIGERQGATEKDRLWLAVSLFWGFGCSNAWPNMLSHGGCVVLQEHFDAGAALELIEQERCTLFYGTPNMAQALYDHPDRAFRDLSSLRSGAALGSEKQMQRVMDLGATEICNVYGMTEVYGNSHITDHKDPLDVRLTTVGRAAPSVDVRIVDHKNGAECPPGVTGEIRLRGYVTPGYYKNAAATAEAFDDEGYFKTGDLGSLDADGNLRFRGRIKEVVKTGGVLVSPAEIEAVLMQHEGIRLAYVVGIPDESRDEVLGAVIVQEAGQEITSEEVFAYCKARMSAYKVPHQVQFTKEAALPLTTTGKVKRNEIAAQFFPAQEMLGT